MAQNGEQVFKLHKLDDRQAYQILLEIRGSLGSEEPIQIVPVRNYAFPEKNFGTENIKTGQYSILEMRWHGRYAENNQSIRVYFRRYPASDTIDPSPYFDYVTIHFDGDFGPWNQHGDKIREILQLVSSRDTPAVHVDTGSSPDILRELILSNNASHRQMMDELNESVKEMIEKRAQLELDAKNSETERRLAHEEALKALDDERLKLQLQSHMSERRNIANNIGKIATDISRSSFKPNIARMAGFYIFLIAISAAIGAGMLSYHGMSIYDARQEELAKIKQLLTQSTMPEASDVVSTIQSAFRFTDWFLILKSVLTGIVAVGFFTYSAAWLKKYYDEDVALAREMQRLNADVARATWVIEAIHEVRHEGKGEVPKEWIDAVTRNLFSGNGDRTNLDDGAMAIRALMGFTANASFGPDGPKFEIGRKGAKELAKADVGEG